MKRLVPHPYFNVKSPEFYKKQKAQYELAQSKFKLVNSIRSGQQQELLQNQIEEIKRKQKALNELTKLQETLAFQLDDQNPRVYGNTAQPAPAGAEAPAVAQEQAAANAAAMAEAVGAEAVAPAVGAEAAEADDLLLLERMNVSKLKENFRDEFQDYLLGKSAWVNKLPRDMLIFHTTELRKLPEAQQWEYMRDLESAIKRASKISSSEAQLRRAPIFTPDVFKVGKSGLKKVKARKQKPIPVSKKPLSMLEQLQQSGPFLERMRRGESEEETEGFGFKKSTKKKTRGMGISKKQKKVLLYGSAVAGNNNSKLLDEIMKI